MFFVSGITGHIGGATARTLLNRGKQIRSLIRNPGKASDGASGESTCAREA